MLLHITALAAVAATAPPFKTAVGLRPAARGLQDFAECPVLTKIKKDDCTDVKDFDALPVCSDPCLCKGMHCRAEAEIHCGAEDKGSGHHNCDAKSIYLVDSALNLPRLQCPPCPARNDKCPALAPLKVCLPGNPAATDCVGHECEFGCKPMTVESHGIAEVYAIGTVCELTDSQGECNGDRGLDNCLGHAGDMDGDFYTVVQVAGAPECPYLEYVDIEGDKDNCPDIDYDSLPKCEDTCLCTGDYCRGQGPEPERCGAAKKDIEQCSGRALYKVTSDHYMPRIGCDVCVNELEDDCPLIKRVDPKDCDSIDDHDSLPFCTDPCLCKGMHCRAERESDGSYDPHCGADDADRNCDDWTIYTVESALNLAHLPPCAPCPARNAECPALEPLKPEECLPGNPAADDCVGHDCVYGCKPDPDIPGREWYPVGTICEVKDSKGECNTERGLDNCLGHDGEMNGDFYKVVQAGKDCPYLEYVDPDNCPDVSYDTMPRCEDPCLCEGDFCRGKGDKRSHCGASEKENCNGRAVYRVTSDFYMPRENCDVCPRELAENGCPQLRPMEDDLCDKNNQGRDAPACSEPCLCVGDICVGEGNNQQSCWARTDLDNCDDDMDVYDVVSTRFFERGKHCPPCPSYTKDCPALEPLKPEECPDPTDKDSWLQNCRIREWSDDDKMYPVARIGAICEAGGECRTDPELDNCEGKHDFYKITQNSGEDKSRCPFLEVIDVDDCPPRLDVIELPTCDSSCLCEGELCRGNGGNTVTPSAEHCGAGGGVNCAGGGVYRVTSTYFYDRDGCPNVCVQPTAKPTKKPTTPYPTRADYGTCPRLEPANECPAKISELPVCSDPCLCKGMRCRGQGNEEKFCWASEQLDNCDTHDVYTVVSALDVPFDSECPPCPPNSNEACPALRPVDVCPADLPTDDCRADEFKDGFAVFPVGTLCSGRGECDTEKRLDNCGSKSVYEVMSIGKQCPYLELIPTSECPSTTEDLQTCHSPCLCEGDLCRGKGDSARHCGAAAGVDNCGAEGIYRVVSTAYMPRSNCGQCSPYVPPPVPGPTEKPISSSGYEDDYIVSANCPILAAVKPGSCPAVITNINCDTPGLQPGELCEADGECGTDKGLNNCDGVNQDGDPVTGADIYIVVPGIDQPTPAPTRNFFVQTSVRFKTDLLDDLAPAWKQDALLLKQIGRALVEANVADVTYDAAWETKPDIPSRRRLDYGSVAAVVNVGLYEPGLNVAGKADPALHVQKLLQFAARGVTEPSLKKALRQQNEALEKSCDYEQTALFAPEDTQEGTAPPGQPTAPPVDRLPTRQPTRNGEDEDEDESEGGGSKKKKSDDDGDAGMIAGIVIACLVALCLCGAAVAYFAQNKKGSSAFKSQSRREAPPPPLPETELGTYSTYSDHAKDEDDPHRVDSNPIVEAAAGSEGDLDDVDIAPGGGDEY